MKLLIELDEEYVKAIDKIRFLVGGRTDRKLQLEIIKAIKNGKALEQEPITNNDLALIHTYGLDEGIRCAMCTNSMRSDRGCDGGCVVNNAMYKKVMDVLEKHIKPTTKNDLGVDAVSRQAVLDLIADYDLSMGQVVKGIHALSSVTPQPRKGHWTEEFNDLEGEVRFICSSCGKYQLFGTDFCYYCGSDNREVVEE